MIKLHFSNPKGRVFSHITFQTVAEDVVTFNKVINQKMGVDFPLPCPNPRFPEDVGLANSSELWFGENDEMGKIDINVMRNADVTIIVKNERLRLLMQLTVLSLCEGFSRTNFSTNEDFSEAVEMYESILGSLSDNACKSLGIPFRV